MLEHYFKPTFALGSEPSIGNAINKRKPVSGFRTLFCRIWEHYVQDGERLLGQHDGVRL
jgi:hypothetical protein